MYRVYLLYALSGFVSLGYQVAWFRIYIDRFGSTNLTFALVVCNFIAGLGVGALVSKRMSHRIAAALGIRDRLRLYGVIEVLVTLAVTLTLLSGLIPPDAWGSFPYRLTDGVYEPTLGYQFSQTLIAIVCVFVPCLFMGVTFPLLCDVYRGAPGTDRFPSALYAWNTLGACTGVLACLFILLPWLGHERMFWLLGGLNLALGAYFTATGGAPAPRAPNDDAGQRGGSGPRGSAMLLLLTCATLSGLLAGSLEGDMFKRIDFISSGNSAVMALISFWAILAIFLASWAVRAAPAMSLGRIKVVYVAGFFAYTAAWLGEGLIRKAFLILERATGRIETGQALGTGFRGGFLSGVDETLLFVGLFVFPAYFCVSMLLPYVCNRIHGQRRHLGLAYGLNTLGFCAGLIGFTLIAPRVSIFYSMKLMMALFGIMVILLLILPESNRLRWWKPIAAAAAFAAAGLLTPRGFDRDYMVHELAVVNPIRALKSNAAHTTFVVETPGGDYLFFNRHPMSSTRLPQSNYMRLMAHVPLLAHPEPRRALLICYGVGHTASAIAAHRSIQAIDVVELNAKVIETAPEFAEATNDVYRDPRISFIIADGRTFLRLTDRRYDLITSEPPPPMQAGVYRLYTREYYAQALSRLSDDGLMTQWVPTYQMPADAVELAIATFLDVFPHALVFTGGRRDFILMGSPAPIDLSRLEQRFYEQPGVAADLRRMGIGKPLSLMARVVQGDTTLRGTFGGGRVIGDTRNDLEFLFHDPARSAVLGYSPFEVLQDIDADRLQCGDELREVLTHLGRLRYHVPDYPIPTLLTARSIPGEIVYADVDWSELTRMQDRFHELRGSGRFDEALRLLRDALETAGDQPDVLLRLAVMQLRLGRHGSAAEVLRRFQQIEPNEEVGYRMLGMAFGAQGEPEAALDQLRRAVTVDPRSPDAHHALGGSLVGLGRLDEGIHHLREALALQPGREDARKLLAVALLRQRLRDAAGPGE